MNSKDVLPVVGIGIPNAPALGDIDGDGVPEIFINGIGTRLTILKANGQPYPVQPSGNKLSLIHI